MSTKPTETAPQLAAFRREIDGIDDKIIALLAERTGIVKNVGEFKKQSGNTGCPIRSGRESEMVRRIMDTFKTTDFSPIAAAAIWRIIIGTSTALECELTISVFAPEASGDMFWLARDYFGPSAIISKQPQINRVIGDVMDGKAKVGILPYPRRDDTSNWWTNLMQADSKTPKIFAHVPFVLQDKMPTAVAIAKLAPEASGNGVSLIVIEADHNVSQHRLQTSFTNAKLEANWINIASLNSANRHHLIEVKGFLNAEHEAFAGMISSLGASIVNVSYLGSYGAPVALEKKNGK